MRKNCFVKLSGDVLDEKILRWLKNLSNRYFLVICVGGGTQINEAFETMGFSVEKFGPLGREIQDFEAKQFARDILEKNQEEMQERLAEINVYANVVIPVIDVGTVLCHINGDQFILSVYHGFDILYVVTKVDRAVKKRIFFAPYPKIEVVSFI